MTTEEQIALAKKAAIHLLNAICDDPRKFYVLGSGTESWSQLTALHAALHGLDVEEIRRNFLPDHKKYERWCQQYEADQDLLRHCRENSITKETIPA